MTLKNVLKVVGEQFAAWRKQIQDNLMQRAHLRSRLRSFIKGDTRRPAYVNGAGVWFAPRALTEEDVAAGRNEMQATGPKLPWKAPYLTGLANPHIRAARRNKYSKI